MTTPHVEPSLAVLAMRAGAHVVAVPIAHVVETMRPLAVEPLAGAPAFILGISIIRGQPTPVLDVAALLTERPAMPPRVSGRFVTLRLTGRQVALSVDSVLALRSLQSDALESLPPLWQGPQPSAVSALATLDRELAIILETSWLLPDGLLDHAALKGTP